MTKERRTQSRLEPCDLTTASLDDREHPPAYGVLSNISELGFCVETDALFKPGQDVTVLLCLNPFSVLIRADVRIMWTHSEIHPAERSAGSFLLGTKMIWMPDSNRRCLQWVLATPHFKMEPSVDSFAESNVPVIPPYEPHRFRLPDPYRQQMEDEPSNGPTAGLQTDVGATARRVSDPARTYNGAVLIIRQGIPFVGRLCCLVNAAGFNAILTNSPETVVSKVRALRPSLVLVSQHVGSPGVSETARRIKAHSGHSDTPVAILTDHYSKPYLLEYAYPVEACLPIDGDEIDLIRNIRLIACGRKRKLIPIGALEGNIQGNTLSEVLYYLSTSGKTGCVTIKTGQRVGRVYMDQGDVVHARLGPLDGIEACHSILGFLQEGYFKFEPDVRPSRTTMREHGVELILRAAEEMDEHRRWCKRD